MRGMLPDRNPLRRRTDRVETIVFAVLLAVVCTAGPFAAVSASNWEHNASEHEIRTQQATSRQVKATLIEDPQDSGTYPMLIFEADARWTAPDGQRITAAVQVPASAKAGSVIRIWTNPSGQLISPLRGTQIPARERFAATTAVLCLATIAVAAALAVRRTLNRHRMDAWGIDWSATEPRWNTRR